MRYNPVPVSKRNVFFFGKVIAGTPYSGLHATRYFRSFSASSFVQASQFLNVLPENDCRQLFLAAKRQEIDNIVMAESGDAVIFERDITTVSFWKLLCFCQIHAQFLKVVSSAHSYNMKTLLLLKQDGHCLQWSISCLIVCRFVFANLRKNSLMLMKSDFLKIHKIGNYFSSTCLRQIGILKTLYDFTHLH